MLNENESFPRAKISSFLVALIVDQYLNDNNLLQMQSVFRNEASSFFAGSLIDEELKSLLKLEMMLDEYMYLKQYKGMLDQQMVNVMQEKHRIQLLLQNLQNSIHVYNSCPRSPLPNDTIMNNDSAVISQPRLCTKTPSGVSTIITTLSQPVSLSTNVETGNFSSAMISSSKKKRKDAQTMNFPIVAKRPRGRPPGRRSPIQGQNTTPLSSAIVVNHQVASQSLATQSSNGKCALDESQVEGSSSCYNVRPSNRVMISPTKQMTSAQGNVCISHVDIDADKENERNRLDASDLQKILDDKSSLKEAFTSESGKEVAIPDIDFSDLDMDKLSNEFILHDLETISKYYDFSELPRLIHCKDNASGSSSNESNVNQITSELSPSANTCGILKKTRIFKIVEE